MSDSRFLISNEDERAVAVFMLEEDADYYIEVMAAQREYLVKEEILVEDVHEYF